ncbi:phosphate ABC transporter ATP-binding protein PstB [Lactobacillus corticis]|uniref:Phosphate ABC transporter ATP-binding protein n=1 Tax=Lactobacillus corticis TaxID=2201249 RepID=A0A916QI46_9LACO|nr:phosphate ABC transporter ATP-binding protein PstB [Lactobacillus corticis]GFZ27769.1 phosphate ABC transporter ATP-binding protein [Lactobacillus corticis]
MKDYNIVTPKEEIRISTKDLSVKYGDKLALHPTTLAFPRHQITALIGASGSGKSTYLRSLNRMNDKIATVEGQILFENVDVNQPKINVFELRKHIGMVFQRPNPFAKTIYENIAYAPRYHGIKDKRQLDEIVEKSLRQAALWNEVKDDLNKSALALSGGQQQRLCIARAIAMKPSILLLDEPASALDPISTGVLEETLVELKKNYTMIMVTHNMQQATRVSDYTAFFQLGKVYEYDKTVNVFTNPQVKLTQDYVEGRFG